MAKYLTQKYGFFLAFFELFTYPCQEEATDGIVVKDIRSWLAALPAFG